MCLAHGPFSNREKWIDQVQIMEMKNQEKIHIRAVREEFSR